MPSNRTIVAALALALLMQAMPIITAQNGQSQGTDLVVERLDVGDGIVRKTTTITVVVKNVGTQTFAGTAGWQLYLGWNPTPTNPRGVCLDRAATAPDTSTVCYQRVTGTDPRRIIAPGDTVTFTIPWTPAYEQRGVSTIVTIIEDLNCTSTTAGCTFGDSTPTGPDTVPANNIQEHRIFLVSPGVRAVPLRDPPDVASANQNTAWRREDIRDACFLAPEVSRVGCKAKPDTLITFEYLVINEGNSGDTFHPILVDDDTSQQNLTHRGFKWSFQPPQAVIPTKGGTQVVRLEILVPKTEFAGAGVNLGTIASRIEWRSALDPAQTTANPPDPPCNTQFKTQGLCQNPSFPSLLIDVARGLNATTNDTLKQANVSQLDEFNFTLNNTGNSFDTYTVQIEWGTSGINDTWEPVYEKEIGVPAFSEKRSTLTLLPPAEAIKGKHPFYLKIQSKNDAIGTTLRRLAFEPELLQQFGITGYLATPLLRVAPAEPAPFVMYLVNNGNGPDNVTLGMENVPFGWNAVLSNRTVQVPPFATVPVYLNVTAPENTPPENVAAVFVNATSQGPSDKAPEQRPRYSYKANLTVLKGSSIRLVAPLTSTFIDPGAVHEFDVIVRNTGNERDNFTITVDRDQSQLAWGATATPGFLVLDPLQQAVVRIAVRAPSTAAVGETSKVFLTVASSASRSTFKQLTLDARVSGPDLFVAAVVTNSSQPYSGDPLELNVVLGNAGNKAPTKNATLKLYFVPTNGAPRPIADRTYSPAELAGGRRIAEQVRWDTAGIDGAGTIIARIDENNEIAEIDESPGSNEASRPITLRLFDIDLRAATGLSGRPGEKVVYSGECGGTASASAHVFCVEYRGNQPSEPVDIYIESENGWGESRLALALPRGSVIPILADVTIPEQPGVARDTLRVTIVPSLRPTARITATTTTTVLDVDRPQILGVIADPAAAKLGQPIALRAQVRDATGLSTVRAFVLTPSNETQTFLLTKGDGDVYSFSQTWAAAGAYRFYIEATDGSESRNVNTSRDSFASFVVQPGSAPTITLAEGQSTTIRSGTLVRLNISDPLGVARAGYSIKGISYDLPRPFNIDTSAFQAGTVDVTVTAENIYGVGTSAKFTLVVDNSPPGIRGVTLDPAKPTANEEVIIRIETDTKVSAVDVLVKRDGQVMETLRAVREGAGLFEVTFTPPQGDYEIDVTAKDVAGNTKLQESAAVFSAKPASPFDVPAPGFALVALAAVALALVMRRRR